MRSYIYQVRERAIEDWPERFHAQLETPLPDAWTARNTKWGTIHKDTWYLNPELEPAADIAATKESGGARFHFMHYIKDPDAFLEGDLRFELVCNTNDPVRDAFQDAFNDPEWRAELEPLLEEHDITVKGNKATYTTKTYDVDIHDLPESYFRTLGTAFWEHQPLGTVVDGIIETAIENTDS